MELGATGFGDLRSRCLTMHVNKIHHVTTINRLAAELGEDEEWLSDVATELEIEDGVIWVYGILAFTDFGIENLRDLVKMHKDNPDLLKRPE